MKTMSSRKSRVPTTRLGRLARLGFTAGEMAVGGMTEGVRRLTGVTPDDAVNVFLTATNAKKLARRLASMRGAAMKMGQVLSMEGADILPPEFSEALAILRDAANTMPDTQIRRVMGREYGKGWEQRFAEFDFQPIAAASIGQVHRARTVDGRDLALKIQYPGVARSIDSDVDNMAMFMRMANILPVEVDVTGIIDEAKRQLRQEADYTKEAEYLRAYRELVKDQDSFVVPKVHDDFTTRHVLAMDHVEGQPLESLGEAHIPQEERDRVGELLESLLFRELFEFRTMQTDPNFANYFYQADTGRIVLLDFGSTKTFEADFVENYRDISRALINDDEDGVLHYAERIGYIDPGVSPSHAWRIMEMIQLVCEPILEDRVYDFAQSDMTARARDAGLDLVMKSRMDELKTPPPETVFLHRKLVGSYLICARIKARVNVQQLIRQHL
jgi:predicted unusual protein kinase regulating ubiquinone biosynthesis (AarF/ABC1/UbiB family)